MKQLAALSRIHLQVREVQLLDVEMARLKTNCEGCMHCKLGNYILRFDRVRACIPRKPKTTPTFEKHMSRLITIPRIQPGICNDLNSASHLTFHKRDEPCRVATQTFARLPWVGDAKSCEPL